MRQRLCLFFLSYLMTDWYVYILRCRHGSLYTGVATDVERRIADHLAGKGAKYLKKQVGNKGLALKLERKVKRLPRHKKEALIDGGSNANSSFSRG